MSDHTSPPLVVIGTGDHAHVVVEALRASGRPPVGVLAPASGASAELEISGVPLIGHLGDGTWRSSAPDARFVVAMGDNVARADVYSRAIALGLSPEPVVHPAAILLDGCRIGAGSQVCAGAVVGVNARVGENAIINTAATIDHDVVLGDHASIGPGAHLAGRVAVGPYSHIGIGASVIEGTTIGRHCLVASGAAVIGDVADAMRVAGVPARPMAVGTPE